MDYLMNYLLIVIVVYIIFVIVLPILIIRWVLKINEIEKHLSNIVELLILQSREVEAIRNRLIRRKQKPSSFPSAEKKEVDKTLPHHRQPGEVGKE